MLARLCPPLHIPRAAVDPIAGPLEALGVMCLALTRPLQRQLITVICDDAWRGVSLSRFMIAGISRAHVCDAVDRMIGYCSRIESLTNVVVCVTEPQREHAAERVADYSAAAHQCRRAGIALREWLVLSPGGVMSALARP